MAYLSDEQGFVSLSITEKFEVKRPGASGYSNDCMDVPFSGYFASNFAGVAYRRASLSLDDIFSERL
jgi:hypothetical protein